MCSVIEIKNANEYYIRYHGPDSMQQDSSSGSGDLARTDLKGSESSGAATHQGFGEGDGTSSETGSTSGHQVKNSLFTSVLEKIQWNIEQVKGKESLKTNSFGDQREDDSLVKFKIFSVN